MRLAAVVGVRVLVCENMAFSGDFQPVLAKHSKNFSLQNALSIGVDQMQRNFDGMRKQVDAWRESQLSDTVAKLIIYRAFIESDLEVPKHLARPGARSVFLTEARGVSAADDVEPDQCLHLGVQAARTDPAVPSHRQARGVPGARMTMPQFLRPIVAVPTP